MVLSPSHTGAAKLGSQLTGHLGFFHGHTGTASAAKMVWMRKQHNYFVLRVQAVTSHLVWELMSDRGPLGSLGEFDRKWLKDFVRQDLRNASSPPRSWNKDQAVVRAEQNSVCTQGPSPC